MSDHWRFEDDLLLVETYGASLDPAIGLHAGDALGAVHVRGVIVIPGDEVVFYLVTAPSAGQAKAAFGELGVTSVRIVPAEWATPLE